MKALTTSQLRAAFVNDPEFLGVFAVNRIPQQRIPLWRNVKFIANLDADNLPGSHWVAVKRTDGHGFYFDSFGRLPPHEIQMWLANNCTLWTYNPQAIQLKSDKVICGYLCISFLKDLRDGKRLAASSKPSSHHGDPPNPRGPRAPGTRLYTT